MKAAVIQCTSNDDINANLNTLRQAITKVADLGAKLAVLPENVAFLGLKERDKLQIAEAKHDGPIQEAMQKMAKENAIWLVAGTIPIKFESEDKVYAASIVYDDKGQAVAHYNKIHLFDVQVSKTESHKESNSVKAGSDIVCVDTPLGRLGLTVCYDLRFPELYRALQEKGCALFSVPAAFTYTTGKVHWEILLRARAIENLAFVLAANQTGLHNKERKTYGHSMIVGPWGDVLASCKEAAGYAIAEIDIEKMQRRRQQFPALTHKQIEVKCKIN